MLTPSEFMAILAGINIALMIETLAFRLNRNYWFAGFHLLLLLFCLWAIVAFK